MEDSPKQRKSRGGRTTHVVRVPKDLSIEEIQHYYTVIRPVLETWRLNTDTSPRYYYLNKLMEELYPE